MNKEVADQSGQSIACRVTDGFLDWLSQADGSLAVTTYQAGKIAMVGWDGRQAQLLLRQFDKPLGMAVDQHRLALATRHELVLFANAPLLARDYLENDPGRYDALFLPRAAYFTGDLNIHDVAFGSDEVWIVNTRFSCLASLSTEYCFMPRWKPPFVSEIVPEDRCHLNGLAMVAGRPKFVTALGQSDVVGGWRENKAAGGVLVDVDSGEVILKGLSMPHSPRWHEGRLWFENSGAGELCVLGRDGRYDVVCALPGYPRGLCFVGDVALICLSQVREKHIFGNLPVQQRFDQLQCGVAAIHLPSGKLWGMIEFTAGCTELFEVRFLPGIRRPSILNLEKEAVRQAFPAPDFSYWLRPSSMISDSDQG